MTTASRLRPTAPRHLWWLAIVLAMAVAALAVVTRPAPHARPGPLPVASDPGPVAPLTDLRAI